MVGYVVFLRVGAVMAVVPAFGEQVVPMRVRLALGLAFTAVVAPAVAPEAVMLAAAGNGWMRALATEVVAGLALGLALRLFVIALQTAGTMAAQATSLSQFFGGAGVDPQPAISQLLVVGGLALAVMAGLHVRLAELLVLSYALMPVGAFPPGWELAGWGVAQVSRAFALAFTLAAPFVIAALVYNMALGAINRAMPQLMVAFVGAPALTLGGLVLLFLVAPAGLAVWLAAFGGFLSDPFGMPP
ncbi:flagellar biosynthetic protein FliR [Rhodobaculum claviforme]|uniref:Flagellar biosynthesis protein FliR n=1 Tax=Rhodobaculum claviforme TaxID=1549854 RepID=A0A934TNK3_9RHOB|nr:flagellar biosynthetic protein FliR [Rhodobaculum claviforme]MBK5928557.1 flagellar biosynthesis protein FliR [Rhodobaculum claviforme]